MVKSEKLGKLSISLGLVLVVFLLMAFAFGTTANADEFEDVEVVEATENVVLNELADVVKAALPAADETSLADVVDTAKTGLSIKDIIDAIINGDDPVDNDFASEEGNNFKGGPHWYLLIENYQSLPDDIEITLWSELSQPNYYQVLTKKNLLDRWGYIRIPAGVPVYIKTNHDIDHWSMLKYTIEGSSISNPATQLPDALANNHQYVYSDTCQIGHIFNFPVGGHILGLWIGLDNGGGDDGDADIGDDDDDDDDADIGDDDIGDDDDGDADIGDDDDDDDDADIGDDDIGDDDADDDDDNDGDDDADADADADADSDVDKDDDNPPKDSPKTGDTRDYMLVTIVAVSSLVVLASTYRKKREN